MNARNDGDPSWRLKVKHTCHTETLKQAALEKLDEFRQNPAGASIQHESAAGIEMVTVLWMKAKFVIVLGFHPGLVMAAIKVPAAFKLFRSTIQERVRLEIESVVQSAGGELIGLEDGAGREV